MWVNEKFEPGADAEERCREREGGRVLFPKGGAKWWEQVWGREVGEMVESRGE